MKLIENPETQRTKTNPEMQSQQTSPVTDKALALMRSLSDSALLLASENPSQGCAFEQGKWLSSLLNLHCRERMLPRHTFDHGRCSTNAHQWQQHKSAQLATTSRTSALNRWMSPLSPLSPSESHPASSCRRRAKTIRA